MDKVKRIVSGLLPLAGLVAMAIVVPGPAGAQSPCGDRVMVSAGDTLAGIARRCGTTVPTLVSANPSINPNVIRPGMILSVRDGTRSPESRRQHLPQPPEGGFGRGAEGDVYTVRPGDTLSAIASRFGITVPAIVSLNPHINVHHLRVGQVLRMPAGAQRPQPGLPMPHPEPLIVLSPDRGAPGEMVRLRGSGLEPNSRLRVLAGPGGRDLETVDVVRSDRRGQIDTQVQVPELSGGTPTIVFAVGHMRGRVVAYSEPFRIEQQRGRRGRSGWDGPGHADVTGTLTRGGPECPTMRGDDGETYSLLGDLGGFQPGDRVRVTGRVAELTSCMRGTALSVQRIRRVR
jgi:LysM repeat protein